MAAEVSLAELSSDTRQRVPDPPPVGEVVEGAGRQRLAAYYLYSALLAGLLDGDGLAQGHWPSKLAEPMERLGLTGLAPRTWRGLDAQLTPAQQDSLRSEDRQSEFARLLVDLINRGAFGPLCGGADSVRLTAQGGGNGHDLELIKGGRAVGTCKVVDHWELVAQYLAGVLPSDEIEAQTARTTGQKVQRQLRESGISHAVSLGTDIAVNIHPLGAAVGIGTRLVRARIRTDREEAGTLRDLGRELSTLRAQADGDLNSAATASPRRPRIRR
jgi:hypothetical protein